MKKHVLLALVSLACLGANGQFSEKSKAYQKFDGFFPFYYDDAEGKVYMED